MSVYDWKLCDQYALAAYYTGRHEESLAAWTRLLENPALPASERGRIEANIAFARAEMEST